MELLSEIGSQDKLSRLDDQFKPAATNFSILSDENTVRVEIRSNAKSNRRALIFCALIVSMTAFAIAIIFALFGAWLILPFAGLEILLLAVGTYIVCSHTDDADMLVISQNYVHLTKQRRSKKSVSSFIRQWTSIVLMPGKTGHEPSRLLLVNRADKLEIGEFLIESSKKHLHQQLTGWVSNHV